MQNNDLDQYYLLSHQYAEAFDGNSDALFLELSEVPDSILETDDRLLLPLLLEHAERDEIINLALLAELIRGKGLFYRPYIKEHGDALELMLSQAIYLLDTDRVQTDRSIMWLVQSLYDTIFHQIRLNDWPEACAILYFELSNKILDTQYMPLYKETYIGYSYSQALYFIDMANLWFSGRKKEFLILWEKIEVQIKLGSGHKWDDTYWPDSYKKLTINGDSSD